MLRQQVNNWNCSTGIIRTTHAKVKFEPSLCVTKTKDLSEELDGFRAEQDRLQAKLEELLSKVTSITEERDQLQDILEGVREERNQLKRDLEEAEERVREGGLPYFTRKPSPRLLIRHFIHMIYISMTFVMSLSDGQGPGGLERAAGSP